jgi:hypothetical protein
MRIRPNIRHAQFAVVALACLAPALSAAPYVVDRFGIVK